MNVQITRGSSVATITLSEDEVRRFMASSRVIVGEMQHALRVAMHVADREAEEAAKPNESARREKRISFARTPQEIDKLRRRAERRKALGLGP